MYCQSVRSFAGRISGICLLALIFVNLNTETWNVAEAGPVRNGSRIINGRKIDISEAPYVVQVTTIDRYFICGGTLVSELHVVTAAHCMVHPLKEYRIVANSSSSNTGGIMRAVERIDIHPKYDPETFNRDVAVLKLSEPLPLGKGIRKVGLCKATLPNNAKLEISGWGGTYERSDGYVEISDDLMSIEVNITPHEICAQRIPITKQKICVTVGDDKKDACQGDSGGPAIMHNRLCGIVSYGSGCGRPGEIAVYTNVTTVAGFIRKSMKK